MRLPKYDFKLPDETGWVTISFAVGGLISAFLTAIGVDNEAALAIGGGAATLTRFAAAFVLGVLSKSNEPPTGV